MAAKGSRIDFMFLAPPYLAAGSATAQCAQNDRHAQMKSDKQNLAFGDVPYPEMHFKPS